MNTRKENELEDRLTEKFIFREYQLIFPSFDAPDMQKAIREYQINSYFHNRVKVVVFQIMQVIKQIDS